MAVIRLEGDQKEKYIKNLLSSKTVLLSGLENDDSIKKDDWDRKVYKEFIEILDDDIFPLFYLLQRTVDAKDYRDNFGKYDQIVLSNGGLPEFLSYRQLMDDKIYSEQKIMQILNSEGIDIIEIKSKEDLVKKWIEEANNNMLLNSEEKRKYLLETVPDKYQTIEFYEKIKTYRIFDVTNPMSKLKIKTEIKRNKFNRYFLSWFTYLTGFGVWNIYAMELIEEADGLAKNMVKDFLKFLEDHMSIGVFFLAREMDKKFKKLYPTKISSFQFGPMFTDSTNCGNLNLSRLFNDNPNGYFLTAIRENIENAGLRKKEDTIDKIIGTKFKWRSEKISEQRFGICSRELEQPLREYIKFPNMRFYIENGK
jgi:hypothetical protein